MNVSLPYSRDHANDVTFVSANFSLPLSLILEPIKQLLYDEGIKIVMLFILFINIFLLDFERLRKLDRKIYIHCQDLLSKL